MGKLNPFHALSGGRASRAEVYGLFLAAVVLIGGGVSGAIAFTNAEDPVVAVTSSPSATDSASSSAVPVESPSTVASSSPAPVVSSSASTGSSSVAVSSCPYTAAELAYWNDIRAGKQQAVDQAVSQVSSARAGLAWVENHLQELLAETPHPRITFQPNVFGASTEEEIAFERERITMNQDMIARAEAALQAAVAARDLVPGC